MTTTQTQRRPSKPERIADEMRRRIALGEFASGTYLPSVRDLCEQLSVSRSTITSAMEVLASEGYVECNERRGTRVVDPAPAADVTTIRLIHPMHPNANVLWVEGSELLRGMEETIGPLAPFAPFAPFALKRYCYRTSDPTNPVRFPESPAPSVFLEAHGPNLDYVRELQRQGVPAVVANFELKDTSIHATWTDHGKAMCEAVRLLVQLGHRRIAYIGYEPSFLFYGESEGGYIRAMKHAGAPVNESFICREPTTTPATLAGHQATQRLLRLADRPTAIVAARDNFAQGVWHAIDELGLVVGRDVSLVGYDDLSWPNDKPQLTTFREPAYEMGAKAARMVVDRIVNGPQPVEQVEIPSELIMRRSAGPLIV